MKKEGLQDWLFNTNDFIFRGYIGLAKFQFLQQIALLPRHSLKPGMMDNHQIWYDHKWYMWRCKWVIHFAPILFDSKSGDFQLKKGSFRLFLSAFSNFASSQPFLITAQKMKFSIKDFFSKCDQIRTFLRIWSHLLKKSLIENFVFCVAYSTLSSH